MLNPENKPTKIILSDGRHIPTNAGLKMTPEEKKRAMDAHVKWHRTDDEIISSSTTWNMIRPLAARNAAVSEIRDLFPELSEDSVKIAVNRKRRVNAVEEYHTPEWTSKRKHRASARSWRVAHHIPPTAHEVYSVRFARELIKSGLIDDSTMAWEVTAGIYGEKWEETIKQFSYGLALEVFCRARMEASRGDWSLFNNYMELGRQTNREWFTGDDFNADRKKISEALTPKNIQADQEGKRPFDTSYSRFSRKKASAV